MARSVDIRKLDTPDSSGYQKCLEFQCNFFQCSDFESPLYIFYLIDLIFRPSVKETMRLSRGRVKRPKKRPLRRRARWTTWRTRTKCWRKKWNCCPENSIFLKIFFWLMQVRSNQNTVKFEYQPLDYRAVVKRWAFLIQDPS